MLTAQRKQIIQQELDRTGRVFSGVLARQFGLSEDTIRRDLRQMAARGLCRRVYGGAVAPHAGPIDLRHDHLREEKARLASIAVRLIRPKQTLLIDAGSTNTAIARMLPADADLTVITNAPDIATLLSTRRDLRLVLLGGVFDPDIGACLGPQTVTALNRLRADWLFLGSCGLDATHGVTAFDPAEAEVKAAMVAATSRLAAAVTTEKLGTAAPYKVVAINRVDALIAEAPDDLTGYDVGCVIRR